MATIGSMAYIGTDLSQAGGQSSMIRASSGAIEAITMSVGVARLSVRKSLEWHSPSFEVAEVSGLVSFKEEQFARAVVRGKNWCLAVSTEA
jgi:hypothetical protein